MTTAVLVPVLVLVLVLPFKWMLVGKEEAQAD